MPATTRAPPAMIENDHSPTRIPAADAPPVRRSRRRHPRIEPLRSSQGAAGRRPFSHRLAGPGLRRARCRSDPRHDHRRGHVRDGLRAVRSPAAGRRPAGARRGAGRIRGNRRRHGRSRRGRGAFVYGRHSNARRPHGRAGGAHAALATPVAPAGTQDRSEPRRQRGATPDLREGPRWSARRARAATDPVSGRQAARRAR